jgi:hypothetical protein
MLAVVPAAYAAGTSTISGKVTDKAAKPLSGVSVRVSSASLGVNLPAQTEANGDYKVSGLAPGTYIVEFGPPIESTFAPQYYNGASSSSEATAVTILTEGEEKSGINATLREGGTISGKVEGPHGEPLQGVAVGALGEFSGFATTNAAGEYTVTGLAKGSYKIEFLPAESAANLVPQYYKGASSIASATAVEVKEEEAKPAINAVLQEGGEISGTVTDAATQQPLGEVCVTATDSQSELVGFAVTAANGTYTIHGIEKGSANVEFEYCPELPGVEYITQSVTGVAVTPGHASDISIALVRSAPVNTAPPVLSGTPAVGQELSCSTGKWTGQPPLEFTYTWLRDGGVIGGAAAATYPVQPADQGHGLACQVTATNSVSHATATSNTVNVPSPTPPPPPPPAPEPSPPPPPPSSPPPSSSAPSPPPPALPTSSNNNGTTPPAPVHKPLTNSQKLAKALTACKKKPKKQRKACEAAARKLYGGKRR